MSELELHAILQPRVCVMSEKQPTSREQFNRINGLAAYAGAVIMTGLIAYLAFDEIQARGFKAFVAGIKQDPTATGIFVAAAIILWAIGFTTGRRPTPPAPPA